MGKSSVKGKLNNFYYNHGEIDVVEVKTERTGS